MREGEERKAREKDGEREREEKQGKREERAGPSRFGYAYDMNTCAQQLIYYRHSTTVEYPIEYANTCPGPADCLKEPPLSVFGITRKKISRI